TWCFPSTCQRSSAWSPSELSPGGSPASGRVWCLPCALLRPGGVSFSLRDSRFGSTCPDSTSAGSGLICPRLDAMRLSRSNARTPAAHGGAVTRRVARRSPPHSSRRFHISMISMPRPVLAFGLALAASAACACPSPTTVSASYYGPGFNGRRTASGRIFRQGELTAAHRSLRFGTKVRVTNLRNGRDVVVTITDRGPYARGRSLDLSVGAARAI